MRRIPLRGDGKALFPLTPIFYPKKMRGSVTVGNTPPTAPTTSFGLSIVGSVTDATSLDQPWGVAAIGNHTYVTSGTNNSLTSVDISTPASPTIDHVFVDATNLNNPRGVVVDGSYAYVATIAGYLTVVDISNPSAMSVAGSVSGFQLNNGYGITKVGNNVYVATWANRLAIVDVTTPASPSITGVVTDSSLLSFATGVVVDGNYAYVAAQGSNRLTVVDVSVPASPSVVGSVQDATNLGSAAYVAKSGNWVFVTSNSNSRLTSVDVSVPATPVVDASLQDVVALSSASGVIRLGSHALVVADEYVSAVDISDPSAIPAISVSVTDALLSSGVQIASVGSLLVAVSWPSGDDSLVVIQITGTP